MKDEEFNNLLRQHAEAFEQKPSSGSFDTVMRKMQGVQRKKRRKILVSVLAGLTILATGTVCIINMDGKKDVAGLHNDKTNTAVTAPQAENKGTAADEATIPANEKAINPATTNTPGNITPLPLQANDDKGEDSRGYTPSFEETVDKPVTAATENTNNTPEKKETIIPGESTPEPVLVTQEIIDEEKKEEQPVLLPAIDSAIVATDDNNANTVKKPKKNYTVKGKWAVAAWYTPYKTAGIIRENQREKNNAYAAHDVPEPVVPPNSLNVGVTTNNLSSKKVGEYRVINKNRMPGFSTGIKATKTLSNHWDISAGLGYSKWNFEGEVWEVSDYSDSVSLKVYDSDNQRWNTVEGYNQGERKTIAGSYASTLHNIYLPVDISYTLRKGRFDFSLNTGIAATYMYAARTVELYGISTAIEPEAQETWNTTRRFNLLATVGGSIGYNINDRWAVFAGPQANASLFSLYKGGAYTVKQAPIFAGLQTGIKIKF